MEKIQKIIFNKNLFLYHKISQNLKCRWNILKVVTTQSQSKTATFLCTTKKQQKICAFWFFKNLWVTFLVHNLVSLLLKSVENITITYTVDNVDLGKIENWHFCLYEVKPVLYLYFIYCLLFLFIFYCYSLSVVQLKKQYR